MSDRVILLLIPGLAESSLAAMPSLRFLTSTGDKAALAPSFPCTAGPVLANIVTGVTPAAHGIVADRLYLRHLERIEHWPAWSDYLERAAAWQVLNRHAPSIRTALWFMPGSLGCGAQYVCTLAPPDGARSGDRPACRSDPEELLPELERELGPFPGSTSDSLSGIESARWIAESAVSAAACYRPDLFYIHLPQYAWQAERSGPASPASTELLTAIDHLIAWLATALNKAYGPPQPLWLVASPYAVVPVDRVTWPNRILREAGLLALREDSSGEQPDLAASQAWALANRQVSHVYVRDGRGDLVGRVLELFREREDFAEVLTRDDLERYEVAHQRSGDLVLVSSPRSWQTGGWWPPGLTPPGPAAASWHCPPEQPPFADPDPPRSPAGLVRGSHGAAATEEHRRGVVLASQPGVIAGRILADTDLFDLILRQFGI